MNIHIRNNIDDMISDFLFYDRKGDEDLPMGVIEKEVKNGKLTVDEIVSRFKQQLIAGLKSDD